MENFESSRQSALFESEKERCMREMIRCSQRRGQNILGPVHYGLVNLGVLNCYLDTSPYFLTYVLAL